jgi:hypothetical protein
MCKLVPPAIAAAVTLAVACSHQAAVRGGALRQGLVLYTKGLSTDPYGDSNPSGFGVVLDLGTEKQENLEIDGLGLGSFGGADWLGDGRIVVPRGAPPIRRPFLYRLEHGALGRAGTSPLPTSDLGAVWSPDGRLIASQPVKPCKAEQQTLFECYRSSGRILVRDADGSNPRVVARARFINVDSWTPDGRLLVTAGHTYAALNVKTSQQSVPLSPKRVAARLGVRHAWLAAPRWSADGRYLAAMIAGDLPGRRHGAGGAFLLADAHGRPLRVIASPYVISMFAWSPVGHRLAYTTSGFPAPHQLLLLDDPAAKPKTLFATIRHFDWITWSPDGRRLLVDDEHSGRWRIVQADGEAGTHSLDRLGGRPLWCCPVNAYARH